MSMTDPIADFLTRVRAVPHVVDATSPFDSADRVSSDGTTGWADVSFDAATVTRTADQQLISWMYWHQSGETDGLDSGIPDTVEAHIIRPYPQATAGTPRSLSFEPVTGAFRFRFTPDPTATAPTVIAAIVIFVPSALIAHRFAEGPAHPHVPEAT